MTKSIDFDTTVRMLRCASKLVRDNQALLSKLDSFGGDGDHGITMIRAMDRIEAAIAAVDGNPQGGDAPQLGQLFRDVGWGVLGVDGGATGPLFGTFFTSMGEAIGAMGDAIDQVNNEELDASALAAAFGAGLEGVFKYTKARRGDKTMIDALEPAVVAAKEAADGGGTATATLEAAAAAAEQGAAATEEMQARFGRAKNMGEKSKGNKDPGATSVALIFKGFFEGATSDG